MFELSVMQNYISVHVTFANNVKRKNMIVFVIKDDKPVYRFAMYALVQIMINMEDVDQTANFTNMKDGLLKVSHLLTMSISILIEELVNEINFDGLKHEDKRAIQRTLKAHDLHDCFNAKMSKAYPSITSFDSFWNSLPVFRPYCYLKLYRCFLPASKRESFKFKICSAIVEEINVECTCCTFEEKISILPEGFKTIIDHMTEKTGEL